jgi:ferric-dicitrate binding protein FerR (iron transport regulator)
MRVERGLKAVSGRLRWRVLGAALWIAAAWPATAALAQSVERGADAAAIGAVGGLSGSGRILTAGRERALEMAAPLFLRETVRTDAGARALLQLGARTTLRLGERARVTLQRYIVDAGGEIEIGSGAIEFDRAGPASAAPLNLRTSYGLITVRGTRFIAGVSGGRYGVFVDSGAVAVTAGGRTVVVTAGLGTNIDRPGAAPTPPAAWGAARIAEARASVR